MALENVKKATFPSGTDADDLLFSALTETLIGDDVYFGAGTLTAADLTTYFGDQTDILASIASNFDLLGELAEKPVKIASKTSSLKTRNYKVAGKRENSVEITIVGISNLQKAYLESSAFTATDMTFVLLSTLRDRMVILNGMRWVVEWSGETDGLYTVVLSTEFAGSTNDRIYVWKDIAVGTLGA